MDSKAETGLTTVGRDAEVAYAQSIVDTVREPLLILDGDMCVKTASRAFYETFRVYRENTERQYIYDLGDGQWDIPALRTLLEEVLPRHKSFQDFEVTHDFPVLGRRVMLLNARQLWTEDDPPRLVLLAIDDVTERRRIRAALVRSNEDLQRFAYAAAHDLSSPLNEALEVFHILTQSLEGKLDEDQQGLLLLSIESLERLRTLLHDMLTFCQVGSAPQQRALVSLEEPLKIALANLQRLIKESGAEISVGALPELPVDCTQIAMVFQNLISNALKYRRAERPSIRIAAVLEGCEWRISVRDNGQGFEDKYAIGIFEAFKRLHGSRIPGSGIGLATCKRIIERFDGRMWADSRPGEGSTFYFTLPASGLAFAQTAP